MPEEVVARTSDGTVLLSSELQGAHAMAASKEAAFSAKSLLVLRATSCAIALAFAILLVVTIQIDGSPFRKSLLTPWMNTTLVDFYLNVAVLCLWIFFRESSTLQASGWVVFLCCLGSSATWIYVTYILLQCKPGDRVSKFWTGK